MKHKTKPNHITLDYYDKFRCIADQCPMTCCQQWKIEVDDATYEKWKSLKSQDRPEEDLQSHVIYQDSIGRIRLNEQKQCPFLNEQKLCSLVTEFSESALSRTCTIFPREIQEFEGRTEASLVSCCPSVVDFFHQDHQITFTRDLSVMSGDLLFQTRNLLITILKKEQYSLPKALMMGYYILLELWEKKACNTHALVPYQSMDFLEELSNTIDHMQFSQLDTVEERNELFLDLSENYRKEGLYTFYLEDIAVMAEQMCKEYEDDTLTAQLDAYKEQGAKYEMLFRNYLIAEVFQECLNSESDLESMLVMIQWITMEYVTIRHAIFLKWKSQKQECLAYETIRDYIVVISRMMGYEENDIFEYMENSFQNIIWGFGYLALILGEIN